MEQFVKNTLTTAESNSNNSLEGISSALLANEDVAYVQRQNSFYRFYDASTLTPNGLTVIAPANVVPPDPGRWIRQGPPKVAFPGLAAPSNLAVNPPLTFSVQSPVDGASQFRLVNLNSVIDPAEYPLAGYSAYVARRVTDANIAIPLMGQVIQDIPNQIWYLLVADWRAGITALPASFWNVTLVPLI